jgi:predicted DNA-binding transcriptional regulator YafY
MAKSPNQKLKLLYLARILNDRTDEDHPITIGEMISALGQQGIEAERKSLYDDIEALGGFGMDIEKRKTRTFGYYVGSRPFELAELKLLVDAVQCSRFITTKKSADLIQKIESLTSRGLAGQLHRQVYLTNRVKTLNESIYYNVDKMHTAIYERRQATFRYYEYTLDKRERFRRNGARYIVNPCALTWDNENYYLIAYDTPGQKYRHYRVDRMAQVEVLEDHPRDPVPDTPEFDLSRYTRSLFTMFAGEEEMVEMEFDNSLVGVVIDRFGKEVPFSRTKPERFRIHAKIATSPPFLSWIVQFGAKACVVGPPSIVEKMRLMLLDAQSCYSADCRDGGS